MDVMLRCLIFVFKEKKYVYFKCKFNAMLCASIFVFLLHLCPIIYVFLALVHRDMCGMIVLLYLFSNFFLGRSFLKGLMGQIFIF